MPSHHRLLRFVHVVAAITGGIELTAHGGNGSGAPVERPRLAAKFPLRYKKGKASPRGSYARNPADSRPPRRRCSHERLRHLEG